MVSESHSAGGVVINPEGKILVVKQRGNSWSLPKGHIEAGEETIIAARREIAEESGITELKLLQDLGSYSRYTIVKEGEKERNEYKTISMFLFLTEQQTLAPRDPHNPEARWAQPNEVATILTHPKDKEFFLNRVLPNILEILKQVQDDAL